MRLSTVNDMRTLLTDEWSDLVDDSINETVQLFGVSFIADEPIIFGERNEYIDRELEWYDSQSLSVNDIPPPIPKIWQHVADRDGMINSNYGWCVYSKANGSQFENVVKELKNHPNSRRASMIYTRPSMHTDYCHNGMSDFVCTSNVTYEMENDLLHAVVQMRSNDAVFGYKNDYAWQETILERLVERLKKEKYPDLDRGMIMWQVANFHIYKRHYYLLNHWRRTGETHITLEDYKKQYSGKFDKLVK